MRLRNIQIDHMGIRAHLFYDLDSNLKVGNGECSYVMVFGECSQLFVDGFPVMLDIDEVVEEQNIVGMITSNGQKHVLDRIQ